MILKRLRERNNWPQEQLAQISGLSIRTIQRIESGNKASLETLKSLAAVFEIDISILREEIIVIDRKSEQWKRRSLWFKGYFFLMNSRKDLLRLEVLLVFTGLLIFIVEYFTPTMRQEIPWMQYMPAFLFLMAHLNAIGIRIGDESAIW